MHITPLLCSTLFLLLFNFPNAGAQTFSGQGGLPFPPGAPAQTTGITTSVAMVNGIGVLGGCNQVDNVTIDLSHTWVGDIALFLISPSGTVLELSSGNGGFGDNYQVTTFSDAAFTPITAGAPPFNGGFTPEGRQQSTACPCSNAGGVGTFTFANTFNGENADGPWQLFLNDYVFADVGTLNSWSISFAGSGTPPIANPISYGQCGTVGGQAVFDLTFIESAVHGGSGFPVFWYTDMQATNPITNPANYVSGATTIYAVVQGPSCSSNPAPITLIIVPGPVAIPQMVDVCSNCAGWAQVNLTDYNNAVNGGSGNIVNWWGDANATLLVPDPTSVQVFGASYWATVEDGSCESAPVEVDFTLLIPNCGASASLSACNTGNGTGVFDLTSVNSTVNGGTSDPVNWYEDFNTTVPITNAAAYTSGGGTVFAVIFDGTCPSDPVPVTLTVTPGGGNANPAALAGCDNGTGQAAYDLTSVENIVNGGSGNPVSWWANAGATVPIANPANYISSGGTVYATVGQGACISLPAPVTLSLLPGPELNLVFNPTICESETFDLSTAVTSPSGQPITFHSGSPATPANQLPSPLVSPNGTSTYLAFIDGGGGCTTELPVTVVVNAAVAPQLSPASVCASETSFSLTTLQDPAYPSGTWSGPGVTGNAFSAAGLAGNVTLSFESAAACTQSATTTITVLPELAPTLGTADICENETSFNLAGLQDPAFPSGTWSGPGVSGGSLFNAAGLSGPVTLAYTPGQLCATPATTTINITASVTPVLSTVDLCSNDPLYPLSSLADPAYPTGTWSGPGVLGTAFNPAGLSGFVTLTFLSDENCAVPVTTTLTVFPAAAPQLGSASVCASETSFSLAALQDPTYPTGTWSGPGVAGNFFSAAGLTGNVTLSFEPTEACTQPGATTIAILPEEIPGLGTANVCVNETAINLLPLQDPDFSSGTWSGPGVVGNIFSLAGQSGTVMLTFTPADNCSQPATTSVAINSPPVTSTPEVDCGTNNLNYTVRFDITGGSPGSYTVNGQPSSATFVSAPISSGSPFSFLVDDGNGCGPVEVSGNFNCGCATFAGSMGLAGSPFEVCSDGVFTANFNNNAELDSDDVLLFVLHDQPGAALGNVLASNSTPTFGLPPNGQLGSTYYVSAVAGNDDGNGSFDLADGCLSVSAGVPVMFYEATAAIGLGGTICAGECFQVPLSFEGVAPFELSYEIETPNGSSTEVFTAPQTDAQLDICSIGLGVVAGQVVIRPISMIDANGCSISLSGSQSATVDVLPEPSTTLALTLCPGESRTVNGTVYGEGNPAGTETFPNGSVQGCDSIVTVNLSFYPTAVGQVTQTLCRGSSIVVNGTVYGENNPSGSEILPNASVNGCDSLVEVALSFNDAVSFGLTETLCPGESRTVNGTVYGEGNPAGTETLVNGSVQGCDSIVTVNLSFYPTAVGQVTQTLCRGSSIVVNGTVYGENNPAGSEILPNASVNGCDSLVEVALSFNDVVSFNLTETLCPGESRTVNGTVYGEGNPAGTETFPNGSAQGCDSIVTVNLSFYPTASGQVAPTLCRGSSIVVNGTVYGENNPAGSEILPNASVNGCDSLVEVALSFNDAVRLDLTETLCPGESRTVNGTVYGEGNPTGTETFPNGSAQGCDSIVTVSLSFYPVVSGQITPTLCSSGNIVVNGTVYDENNPSGSEILPNASVNGCDSLVEVALSFNDAVSFNLTETLCPGESRTVNGTVYGEGNPAGSETFPNGSAQGCDSIVMVNLSFYPTATGQVAPTLCRGSSIVVNGTVYGENNPAGSEILPNASVNGCDSLVEVALSFNDAVSFDLTETLCPGESRTVNGTVYGEGNPTGSETFPNGSVQGCDSIVTVNLSFYPTAAGQVASTLCRGSSIVVNGTVYGENNPAGSEILPNASVNGCDSLVEVVLSFNDAVSFNLTETLCPGESRTVNGTVYGEGNPAGSETFPNGSAQGCDSIVTVNLSFYPAAAGQVASTLCRGSSIVVNGTVYGENNPAGSEILPNASINGCDSLVEVALSFNDVVSFNLTETLCPGESRTVNGTVYGEGNPTGTETFPNGSAQGCDSIVTVSLSFYSTAVGQVTPTLCIGSSIVVNGTVYGENNPSGSEILPNASVNGCDSLVEVALSFNDAVSFNLTETLCPGESRTVNGTVYGEGNPAGTETFINGSAQGCDSIVTVNLSFYPEAVFELAQTLNSGELATVNGIVYDEDNPTGVEVLEKAAANGCDSTVIISLTFQNIRNVYIPNAFSPNGDGRNDQLAVFASQAAVSVRTFRIFDRWGGAVFEQSGFAPNDVAKGWDGTHKGKALDPGVFVYFTEVEFSDGTVQLFKGEVLLLR